MEFTDLYKQSNSALVKFSPDGQYIAVAVEHRLIVRDAQTPKRIHRVYSCAYETAPYIQEVAWSADSQYLLTASYQNNRVDVWSLDDEQWRCAIHDEVARIERAQWGPDSRHILTLSELDLRLSIWSLLGGEERRYIQGPKGAVGIAVHPSGGFIAVAQRHDYRDYVGIYDAEEWRMVREVELTGLEDAVGMAWSPDGLHLVAWDTASSYSVVVINIAGLVKRHYAPEDAGLGVRRCAWAPSGQLLALGGYDRRVRVLNNLTWRPVAVLTHRTTVSGDVDAFTETEVEQTLAQTSSALLNSQPTRRHTRFDLEPMPVQIRVVIPADVHRAANAEDGRGFLAFNAEGTLLASVVEAMPNALWIWRVADMRLVTVVQTLAPLRSCQWSPVESVLAFVTGAGTVYVWKQEHGCHLYEIPAASLAVGGVAWNPNGDSLAVLSKGVFSLAFLTE
ncbi:WD repeat-containing protein wrap73 [Coemansia sp. Benny D115]|nr:WD repeat-containing protein wrap73 [Coemansia sp. Benny D115]